jgi:hypothetical protein
MTKIAQRVVMISAALLPTSVRERYREQWLGELRDAPELGLRSSEIAMGSLVFASTFARKSPSRRRPGREAIARRERLSIALAASAAALAFSQNASAPWSAQTGTDAVSSLVGLLWTMLTIYVVVAPIAALLAVLVTRGTRGRVRAIVAILAAVCTFPIIPFFERFAKGPDYSAYLALSTIGLPVLGIIAGSSPW